MKKTLKIIGIVIAIIIISIVILLMMANKNAKQIEFAQKNADDIISNLDKTYILNQFPPKNFPNRAQLQNVVSELDLKCDWKNRDGKFVDFYTMKNVGGTNQVAFIYEYYLKCDSLRFILTYNLFADNAELSRLDIQPLEVENPMIIYPEKQLKNRR